MTPDQHYLFDTTGYLHLPGTLDSTELAAAQAAVQRYIDTPPEELPPGFAAHGGGFAHRVLSLCRRVTVPATARQSLRGYSRRDAPLS